MSSSLKKIKKKLSKHYPGESFPPDGEPWNLLEKKYLKYAFAYSSKKNRVLYLEEPFTTGKHVRLMNSREGDLVVKWYHSGERKTDYESSVYGKLKKLGCPLPYFSKSFLFWDEPVLVLEKMEKLGRREKVYLVGCQVIEQLRYLHSFAVHCDIKPDNIMKRVVKSKSDRQKTTYFLIDYGGVAQEKLSYGYKRWIWSKHWTSQKSHTRKQIATAKHDLKELGYTLNYLRNNKKVDPREEFSGRIKRYMDRVEKINKRDITSRDYEDLLKILKRE